MDYKVVFIVALMLATTMCVPRGPLCPCPKIYLPLCAKVANKEVTFNSMCEYQCQHDFVKNHGGSMEILYTGSRCH
uniref:Kazal-like domain-containing protein n=1 Tax=Heliothis virescens TaxID=7102 RepID=A0A2A4J3A9_HELVI